MKTFLFCLALVGLSMGAPQGGQERRGPPRQQQQAPQQRPPARTSDEPIRTLRFENVNNGDGSYSFGYETENGISVQEDAVVEKRGGEDPIAAITGFFQYFDPEGQKTRVDYNAGKQGFVATGDHLPVPPPIPEAIMKSLAIIYANAEKQKQQERNDQNRNRF